MKKGFTLVELLAVIAILAIISSIAMPSINTSIRNSREGAYLKQIDIIEAAAKKWGVENDFHLPEIGSDEIATVDLNTLYTLGYLKEKKIINPKTEEELKGCVKLSYNMSCNQYEYTYIDNLTECDSYNVNNK